MRMRSIKEARQRRADRAAVLARQGSTGLTDKGERILTAAQGHFSRAQDHHDSLSEGHDSVNKHLTGMVTIHRKLTSTLANLGVRDNDQVSRHLSAFSTHLRAARSAYEDSADSHVRVGDHLGNADKLVRSVLVSGAEQSAPESDEDKTQETARDRARRARELQRYRP